MIPFPGESLGVWSASDVGGIGEDLTDLVKFRAGSATLASGGEWVAWIRHAWPDYLEDDTTPVVVSWVVEVASGSVTVDVSEGTVTGYDETDPTPVGLGSHTLTAGTNVVTSTLTATDVLGDDELMVRLEATSGSAVVQQVKMRVWPTVGVAGDWSDTYPSYTREAVPSIWQDTERRVLTTTQLGAPGSTAALWDAAVADLQTHTDELVSRPTTLTGVAPLGQTNMNTFTNDGGILGDAQVTMTMQLPAVAVARTPASGYSPDIDSTLDLDEGVDYIRPPEEVFGDNDHLVDADGSVGVEWINTTLETIHENDDIGEGLWAAFSYVGDVNPLDFTWPDSTAGTSVTIPEADTVVIVGSHSYLTESPDFTPGDFASEWQFVIGNGLYGWDDPDGGDSFVPMRSLVTFPPYRVWTPTAVTLTRHPHLIFWRTDGLGAGAGLVFKRDTRQSSGLVFGNT